ncbi:MAG: glycosyltransferase family 9 protein [Candidatus Mcinerneyibacterium aminivorans]|uniref:Glycosyltransferase family 9 protein n=1 Tax=Candidatus Mcinerneyibacterium aminivorans TaxID=2703815 RepID=A0A5D0MJ16_9BACT|nr:MAG: glycosyltransferase family 9 protein [Candidatus Mcinerneyibacterium aminivorans]
MNKANNILIITLNYMGDVLMTLPLVYNIKRKFENCNVFLSAGHKSRGLKNIVNDIDKWFFRSGNINFITLFFHIKKLKKYNFDKIILIRNAKFTHKIAKKLKSDEVVGLKHSQVSNLEISIPERKNHRTHITDSTECIANYMGIEDFKYKVNFDKINCRTFKDKFIVFSPGTTRKAKMMPVEKWKKLGKYITKNYKYKIYIVGSKKDKHLTKKIKISDFPHENIIGKTNLRELYCYLKNSELTITVDNGTMHLCDLTDAPLISLFGSTNPRIVGPKSQNSYIIQSPLECKYCGKNKCSNNEFCMAEIDEKRIFNLIDKIL